MIAQRGIYDRKNNGNPNTLQHDKLIQCLRIVASRAAEKGASIHMPRIGTGLGNSSWDIIERCIESAGVTAIETYVYDLP